MVTTRELGLLRKRSSSTAEREAKRLQKYSQLFSHLIVIDFESTCWKEKNHRSPEIIEFPAVLLQVNGGQVISEFQHYVQPQENPILSDFCTELTGITQDEVEQGIPLSICLSRFSQWLITQTQQHGFSYNEGALDKPACTFVTWSDWDLGVCLQYECRRKQLRKPPQLNSWIDLRATYRTFYGRKPKGLNGALQEVGIEFEGREHSGLHDARNTARLAWRMMCDGCVMTPTKTLPGPTGSVMPRVMLSTPVSDAQEGGRKSDTPAASPNLPCRDIASAKGKSNFTTLKPKSSPFTVYQDKKQKEVPVIERESLMKKTMRDVTNHTPVGGTPAQKIALKVGESSGIKIGGTSVQSMATTPSFKTPMGGCRPPVNAIRSFMSKTPPMCQCGRRAKLRYVQKQGPNMGRGFLSCPVGNTSGKGCGFFKWDICLNISTGASPFMSHSKKSCNPVLGLSSLPPFPKPNFATPEASRHITAPGVAGLGKKTLGIRNNGSNSTVLKPPRLL